MGERTEQRIAGPEHGTRADDGCARKRFLDQSFAAPARANVRRTGLRIGADTGDENEASNTGTSRLPCKSLGALLVHGLERYTASLDIGRDCIDDRIGLGDGAGDRGSVTHVGAEHRDPFHARRTERNSRLVGMPDCNAHSHSLGSEAPHETLAEKPVPPNTLTVVIAFHPVCRIGSTRTAANDSAKQPLVRGSGNAEAAAGGLARQHAQR